MIRCSAMLAVVALSAAAFAADAPLGTWEWIETEETEGIFTCPDDAGYTVQLEFRPRGAYREFRDEVLVQQGSWEVYDSEYDGTPVTLLVILIPFDQVSYVYSVAGGGVLEFLLGGDEDDLPDLPAVRYERRDPIVARDPGSWGGVKALFR